MTKSSLGTVQNDGKKLRSCYDNCERETPACPNAACLMGLLPNSSKQTCGGINAPESAPCLGLGPAASVSTYHLALIATSCSPPFLRV